MTLATSAKVLIGRLFRVGLKMLRSCRLLSQSAMPGVKLMRFQLLRGMSVEELDRNIVIRSTASRWVVRLTGLWVNAWILLLEGSWRVEEVLGQ